MKKDLRIVLCLVLLFWGADLALSPSCGADKTRMIKFATLAPEGSTWMKHMRGLDRRLRQRSGGRLGLRLYAGGIAGDELDVLRKIRIGQIHCAAFSGVGIAKILPMVRVLDLPFLFRDEREVDRVHGELRDFFAAHFREKGFEFLGWAEVGNVHLFSTHPLQSVEDLAGRRIWTWSGDPVSKETFGAMGTNPIPLSVTDVTTALATGMIDTVYAPPLGALALQWHLHLKYMTSLPLAHATGAVLISKAFYAELPPDLSSMLVEEFGEAMVALTADLRAQSAASLSLIRESGLEILPLPPDSALEGFYRVHETVAQRLSGRLYDPELLERVYRVLNRAQ